MSYVTKYIYNRPDRSEVELVVELPAVRPAVGVMSMVADVVFHRLVVHGLYHRDGVSLHDVHGHFDYVLNRDFHDAFDWDWVVDRHLNDSLNWYFHDSFNVVGNGLVNLDVLDFDDWHRNLPDNWNLDGVGLGYVNPYGVGLGHGVRLWDLVSHFTQNLVGFVADAVLCRSSVIVGEAVDFVDDGVFGVRESTVGSSKSSTYSATKSTTRDSTTAVSSTTAESSASAITTADSRSKAGSSNGSTTAETCSRVACRWEGSSGETAW